MVRQKMQATLENCYLTKECNPDHIAVM